MSPAPAAPTYGLAADEDDLVLPFRAEATGVMGRLARLGPCIDAILARHAYPEPVSRLLGEAVVLCALLGASLDRQARLILQTRTDGPVGLMVVTNEGAGALRGYASFEAKRLFIATASSGALLGAGHLALTIDPGRDLKSYQGIVALDGQGLIEAALAYFRQSVQLPSFVRIAVARRMAPGGAGWHWRAGGLMVQHLSPEGGSASAGDRLKGDGSGYEPDESWERTRLLAETVEDHELIDPTLPPASLLMRLFHEDGVRAYGARPVEARCSCSRERLGRLLRQLEKEGNGGLAASDGMIEARCEFCSTVYRYPPDEVAASAT
jgi:molecular chaperone Hsp33